MSGTLSDDLFFEKKYLQLKRQLQVFQSLKLPPTVCLDGVQFPFSVQPGPERRGEDRHHCQVSRVRSDISLVGTTYTNT
jgi:hypothetical protein